MSPNNMIVELLNHPYERTLADLDQEFRESIDPEEEALRRKESEEQSQLADALDAEAALLGALNSGKVCAADRDVLYRC